MIKLKHCLFVVAMLYLCISFVYGTILYEQNVYDCTDMSIDQKHVFELVGIHTDYAVNWDMQHMWLILDIYGHDVHWEPVMLMPWTPREYDERFNYEFE